MCHFSKFYSLSINKNKSIPINWMNIQITIQANENGIPKIKGSTLFPILQIGKIKSNNIRVLNNKKYKSNLFLLFIIILNFFLSYLLVISQSNNRLDPQ